MFGIKSMGSFLGGMNKKVNPQAKPAQQPGQTIDIPPQQAAPAPVTAPQTAFQQPPPPAPGAGGYRATTAPFGLDQTGPGAGEQMWQNNQNLWMNSPTMDWQHSAAPSNEDSGNHQGAFNPNGQGQQFWNQIAGKFNEQGGGNLQPQFDAAYDRGEAKAVGAANQQAAARGAYGNSASLNNVGNVINDFEANRGKAATDFALANSQNQQNMANTYGNLAFGAGRENLSFDAQNLNRLNSMFGNASSAQGMRDSRLQGMFNNVFNQQNAASNFANGQYAGMFGADENAFGGAQDAALGRASQNQNYGTQVRGNAESGLTGGINLATGIAGLSRSGAPQQPQYPQYGMPAGGR